MTSLLAKSIPALFLLAQVFTTHLRADILNANSTTQLGSADGNLFDLRVTAPFGVAITNLTLQRAATSDEVRLYYVPGKVVSPSLQPTWFTDYKLVQTNLVTGVGWTAGNAVAPFPLSTPLVLAPGDYIILITDVINTDNDMLYSHRTDVIQDANLTWNDLLNGQSSYGCDADPSGMTGIWGSIPSTPRLFEGTIGYTVLAADTNPPTILLVKADSSTQLTVTLSEMVDPTNANDPANYSLSGAVSVTAATLSADQTKVVLTTSPLASAATYTLTMNHVLDLASPPNSAVNSQITFVSSRTSGYIGGTFLHSDNADGELFDLKVKAGSGVVITNFDLQRTGDPMAVTLYYLPSTVAANQANLADYTQLTNYTLVASHVVTGNGQGVATPFPVYLPLPPGDYSILFTDFSNSDSWNRYSKVVDPVSNDDLTYNDLANGQLSLGVDCDGTNLTAIYGDSITPRRYEGAIEYTVVVPGPAVITSQPSGVTVNQNLPFQLNVMATGTLPVSYQWRKDGTNVSGATNVTYQVLNAQPSDSGNYTVTVQAGTGAAATSTPPTVVTVYADTNPPVILSSSLAGDLNSATLIFSEPLSAPTATQAGNYRFSPTASVTAAVLSADFTSVTLSISGLALSAGYVLSVTNVSDLAGNPVAPGTHVNFTTPAALAADADYLPTPGKVAFIGNSLTMYNGGSDSVVKKLGDAMSMPLNLMIDSSLQHGGWTLKDHWTNGMQSIISNGNFNVVVMQEGGDLTYSTNPANAAQFYQYGKLWADVIRKAGTTPVLYMMWAWREDVGEAMKTMTDHQAALYDNMAQIIHAKVIPIGRGYYKLRNDPSGVAQSINLFVDYQHPSASATYFIGCIAFAALYNISPVGNSYLGADIVSQSSPAPTQAQAEYMQTLAWETWRQYGGDDGGLALVPPSVSIEFQRDNFLTLRWPDWVNGWLPYAATSLAPPLLWLPVTNAVSRSNGQFAVELSHGASSGFFRLSRP